MMNAEHCAFEIPPDLEFIICTSSLYEDHMLIAAFCQQQVFTCHVAYLDKYLHLSSYWLNWTRCAHAQHLKTELHLLLVPLYVIHVITVHT